MSLTLNLGKATVSGDNFTAGSTVVANSKDYPVGTVADSDSDSPIRLLLYRNVAEDSHLYRRGMNAASTEFTQVIEGGQLEIFEL